MKFIAGLIIGLLAGASLGAIVMAVVSINRKTGSTNNVTDITPRLRAAQIQRFLKRTSASD
jgi:hypothetical protein